MRSPRRFADTEPTTFNDGSDAEVYDRGGLWVGVGEWEWSRSGLIASDAMGHGTLALFPQNRKVGRRTVNPTQCA